MKSAEGIYPDHILVKQSKKSIFLDVNEISLIESCGNYLKLHARGQSYLMRGALYEAEKRLSPSKFLRIHCSYIVNVNKIQYLVSKGSGDYLIRLKNGKELNMSRNYNSLVKKFTLN